MKRGLVWALTLGLYVGGGAGVAETGTVARIGASGEAVELSHQVEDRTVVETLPLHHVDAFRYFSAGVGLEERAAEYPPFPLKLVFTAGGRPYVSGVSVTIQSAKGGMALIVPQDQVEGPWLFVDLPAGDYDVTASYRDHEQRLTGIKVEPGKQKVVHLGWAEDPSVAGN